MNCEGEGSDDKNSPNTKTDEILKIKIKWAVLKWNDWWMVIKAINEES